MPLATASILKLSSRQLLRLLGGNPEEKGQTIKESAYYSMG